MNREIPALEEWENSLAWAEQFVQEARHLVRDAFATGEKQRRLLQILDQLQKDLQTLAGRDRPVVAVVPLYRNLEQIFSSLVLGLEPALASRRTAFDPHQGRAVTPTGAERLAELPPASGPYEVFLHPPLNEAGKLEDQAQLAEGLLLLVPQSDLRNAVISEAMQSFRQGQIAVVVLVEEEQEVEQDVEKYRKLWQEEVPECELRVRWGWMPYLFPEKQEHLRKLMQSMLVELVPPGSLLNRQQKAQQCVQRTVEQIKVELQEIETQIAQQTKGLQTLSGRVAQVVREEVLPPERTLAAMVQQQLLTRVVTDTPVGCFPYRDVAGLLALLFGVWTRLWGMATGSIIAWVRGAWQASKNLSQMIKYLSQWNEAAVQRCQQRLQREFGHLVRNISRILNKEASKNQLFALAEETQPFEVQGVDRAVQISFQIVQQEINSVAPSRGLVLGFALTSTVVFAFLIAGPILAVYQKYLVANWNSLIYGEFQDWKHLPVFHWRYILSVVLYCVAPVFLGAMIALSLAARKVNVQRAVDKIRQEHQKLTDQIQPYIRVRVREPRVQAYLDLRRLLEQHGP